MRRGFPLIWLWLSTKQSGQDASRLADNYPRETWPTEWPRQLMDAVWGEAHKGRNLLTVYMYRLRAKLWPDGADMPIVTLRGRGYMFIERAQPDDTRELGGG